MYIGEVSRLTGASQKAIRLYESMGLIPPPTRKGKYRDFTATEVEYIQLIKMAQRFGVTLIEIRNLFDDQVSCEFFPWERVLELADEKILAARNEIARLEEQCAGIETIRELLTQKYENLRAEA